ncbi:hypothetical protein [Cerasicoccus maritimus]|uniref:hypothetical protein n=1 Tax=Cerasicoccus maritimus TaxID=490089 RepID=UPI002852D3E2|nr:hypothetical protein [Cerasicoccus maritimus]
MGRKPTGSKPKESLNVRIDPELRARIDHISAETRLSITGMIESALDSIADYYDEHGELLLPLATLPRRRVEHLLGSEEKSKAS